MRHRRRTENRGTPTIFPVFPSLTKLYRTLNRPFNKKSAKVGEFSRIGDSVGGFPSSIGASNRRRTQRGPSAAAFTVIGEHSGKLFLSQFVRPTSRSHFFRFPPFIPAYTRERRFAEFFH